MHLLSGPRRGVAVTFQGEIIVIPLTTVLMLSALATPAATQPTLLDEGYRHMYNLDFAAAHRAFGDWEKTHPGDPLGAVSDAAAYLFAEFDRLHVLRSEFFTDDGRFLRRERSLTADAATKRDFEDALDRAQRLASATLARAPQDENALFATLLRAGLHADYLAFIEKHNRAALSEIKQSRGIAQRLLTLHPDCYDAYLAVGIENYLLSLKPLPLRWVLRLGGAQTDKRTGIERLRITANQGRYLQPYARLLLAVAALRDKDTPTARRTLTWLASEFPNNKLYREELLKLK
jgi:hypothetical protein